MAKNRKEMNKISKLCSKPRNNIFVIDLKLFFWHANQVNGVLQVETLIAANVNE